MSDVPDKTTNQSTVSAFSIIEAMAPMSESARVTDLARNLGMPRAKVYRYLQTLCTLGYVRQDPETERYRLTLKLFHIGQAIADGTQLTTTARPVMMHLRDATSNTVTLSVPEHDGMRVVDIVRTDSPVQIVTKPGALLAFHASAQGKLALAFGSDAQRQRILSEPLHAVSTATNTDPDRLAADVAEAQKKGWAVAPEETLPGVNALSAPIFDLETAFIATITIAGSTQDIRAKPSARQLRIVTEAARTISENLGCREYPV